MTNSTTYAQPPSVGLALRSLLMADLATLSRNRRAVFLGFVPALAAMWALFAGSRGNTAAVLGGVEYRVAASLMFGIASNGMLGYPISMVRDRERGVFTRLRVTPAPSWTIIVSRLLVQTVAILVMAVIVLVVATVLLQMRLSPAGYVLTLVAIVFASIVFLCIGQTMVGLIRSADTVNAVARFIYLPVIVLGLFAHSAVFGTTFELIARWSPGGVVALSLNGAMQPSTWSWETSLAALGCVMYAGLFGYLGTRWFRWTRA